MSFNWLTFVAIVVAQYVIGALWYSLLFGKQWLKINHPNGLPSKEEMKKLADEATPYYIIQLALTVFTLLAQWYFVSLQPSNWLNVSLIIWIGFLVPSAIQAIIWSDPKNKYKLMQIGIMALNYLVTAVLAGWVFGVFR